MSENHMENIELSDTGDNLENAKHSLPPRKIGNAIKNHIYLIISIAELAQEISKQLIANGYSVIDLTNENSSNISQKIDLHDTVLIDSLSFNHPMVQHAKSLKIPLITLSNDQTIEARLKSVRMGHSYFVPLPIDIDFLQSTIDIAMTPRLPHPYKILVIDDDEMLAAFHEMIIRRSGMQTKIINSPLMTFSAIDDFKPDLILMDLYMPSCSGAELSRIIRQKEEYSGIPIIFLSTESDISEQMAAMEFGGDDFLSKPITPERLIATISNRARRAIEANTISSNLKLVADELKAKTIDLDDALTVARSAEALKSRLIATMSHEIRTPINGMLGIMDKLLQTKLDSEQKEFSEIILSSTESLLSILNDTLDFSKLEAGKMTLENIAFSPEKTINQVHKLFDETASSKGVRLTKNIEDNIPKNLYGDPVRLKQVLINLINNAIKFTDHGKITTDISIKSHDNDTITLLFKVIDEGIGLTPEQQDSIFDEYAQADTSTSRTHGGTGLGLSICQKLSKIMGGDIGVTSKAGSGSTFWFSALLSKQPDKPSKETPLKEKALPTNYSQQHPIALIAEDNDVNQMIISSYLQKHGISCHIANNGENAVSKFSSEHYHIVFMDCQMPVLDGYQATRMIRNLENETTTTNTPIIAMTGNALDGDREKCLDAGMNDYLSKPINKQDLAKVLEKWLAKK